MPTTEPLRLACERSGRTVACSLENRGPGSIVVSDYALGDPAAIEVREAGASSGSALSQFSARSAGASASNLRTLRSGERLAPFSVELPASLPAAFVVVQHLGDDGAKGWSGVVVSNVLEGP